MSSIRHRERLALALVLASLFALSVVAPAMTAAPTTSPTVTTTSGTPAATNREDEDKSNSNLGPWIASLVALTIAIGTAAINIWRRPKLSVHFDRTNEEDIAIAGEGTDDETRWLRVRVANAPNRRTAESVEVLAESLQCTQGAWKSRGPVSFRTLRWTHYGETERLNIAPGAARYLDVIKLNRGDDGSARARLKLFPKSSDPERYVLDVGEYVLRVIVTATDANARRVDIKIKIANDDWPLTGATASLDISAERS